MEGAIILETAKSFIQEAFEEIFSDQDTQFFENNHLISDSIWGEIMSVELPDAEALMNFLMMFAGTVLVLTIVALKGGGFIVVIRNRRGPTPEY